MVSEAKAQQAPRQAITTGVINKGKGLSPVKCRLRMKCPSIPILTPRKAYTRVSTFSTKYFLTDITGAKKRWLHKDRMFYSWN